LWQTPELQRGGIAVLQAIGKHSAHKGAAQQKAPAVLRKAKTLPACALLGVEQGFVAGDLLRPGGRGHWHEPELDAVFHVGMRIHAGSLRAAAFPGLIAPFPQSWSKPCASCT